MNRDELIDAIAGKHSAIERKVLYLALAAIVETITKTLRDGGEVKITNFGVFSCRERKARVGVNPRNPTERINIPAVRVPKFRASTTLKQAVRTKT